MTTREMIVGALVFAGLILGLSAVAEAQTVIVHQPPVQRVIVEHHYPAGVTYIPGTGGSRTIIHNGHYGASTCYRECFHQGSSVTVVNPAPTTVIVRERVLPRTHFSFGFSDGRTAVGFGITDW